jgi:uncharacterized damage-inducible protein DinB
MTLTEFLRGELRRLHTLYDRAVADLTDEEWHRVPEGKGNSIAFIAWHYARTEDNIVRFILQDRRPTVWMEGGWAEKLGLPPVAQGTGMAVEEAQALRIPDTAAFRQYMAGVWAATDEFLASPDEAALAATVLVRPLGEMPKIRALGQVCVTHGFSHLGQIDEIRALLDKPALGI